jgi:hypothetical protein
MRTIDRDSLSLSLRLPPLSLSLFISLFFFIFSKPLQEHAFVIVCLVKRRCRSRRQILHPASRLRILFSLSLSLSLSLYSSSFLSLCRKIAFVMVWLEKRRWRSSSSDRPSLIYICSTNVKSMTFGVWSNFFVCLLTFITNVTFGGASHCQTGKKY